MGFITMAWGVATLTAHHWRDSLLEWQSLLASHRYLAESDFRP